MQIWRFKKNNLLDNNYSGKLLLEMKSATTFSTMTFSIMTFGTMTFSIMTLSTNGLKVTFSITMLCHYAECSYASHALFVMLQLC